MSTTRMRAISECAFRGGYFLYFVAMVAFVSMPSASTINGYGHLDARIEQAIPRRITVQRCVVWELLLHEISCRML